MTLAEALRVSGTLYDVTTRSLWIMLAILCLAEAKGIRFATPPKAWQIGSVPEEKVNDPEENGHFSEKHLKINGTFDSDKDSDSVDGKVPVTEYLSTAHFS